MGIRRGGDGRKPGSARYVMWALFVSFFSLDHEHNFVVKHTVLYSTALCNALSRASAALNLRLP